MSGKQGRPWSDARLAKTQISLCIWAVWSDAQADQSLRLPPDDALSSTTIHRVFCDDLPDCMNAQADPGFRKPQM